MLIFTLIVLLITSVLFAIGRVRSDVVAACALLTLMIGGVLTPQEGLAGFSNQVVVMMAGLFVVGGAILQTGLAQKIGAVVVRLGGKSETMLFLLVMLTTTLIGGFVSNTGTVALMLPIIVSLATSLGISPSRFLMPIAFASSIGGMLTLIGTPPNLVIQDTLTNAGFEPLKFFSFTPVGLIILVVGILVLLPLSKWLTRGKQQEKRNGQNGKSLAQLAEQYGLNDRLSRMVVSNGSAANGKTVAELDINRRFGVNLLEVRHEHATHNALLRRVEQSLASAETRLQPGDIIYVAGESENVQRMQQELRLKQDNESASMDFYDIGLAEVVLLNTSRFVGKKLKETGFRSKYQLNVIGIRQGQDYIMNNLPEHKLEDGDVLLVQGTWQAVGALGSDEDHWVVLGQPLQHAKSVTLDYKAPMAAVIMLLMIAAMVFDFIPIAPVTAVLIAAVLMVLTGCFKSVEAAYQTISWESIMLIATMMPMSTALEKTGASALLTEQLVGSLGTMGPVALLAGIYFTTSLLTMFISNTACAVLMAPIALSSAQSMGVSPYPMLFAVTVAASMCFASPFSTPPNALVMKAGRYTFMDYIRVGLPLQLIIGIVMIIALPLLFPFN